MDTNTSDSRTPYNVNMESVKANVPDIKVAGDPGAWKLVCKASSEKEGWMKSTKVMQLPNGVLVQVTEREALSNATALTFVPNARLSDFGVSEN